MKVPEIAVWLLAACLAVLVIYTLFDRRGCRSAVGCVIGLVMIALAALIALMLLGILPG